jgi:uncharacterized integral membrane protein
MQKGLMIGIGLALAMVIFTLQNPATVQVKFFFWKITDVPVALFMIISISLGAIIASVFSLLGNNRYKSENKELKEEIEALKADLDEFDKKQEAREIISEDGMTIHGDPGSKFFDD